MDTNNKFSKFVAKIEQKMLDSNQESMIIHAISGEEIGGSNGTCENTSGNCNSSINRRCTNGNSSGCSGSMNSKCNTTISQ